MYFSEKQFFVNILDYSPYADGVNDDFAVLQNIINVTSQTGMPKTIYITGGIFRVGSNLTIPSGIILKVDQNASLKPDSGITITINSQIDAGKYQIFAGLGSITGVPKIDYYYPEWFGAVGDKITDDTIAIQKCIDFAYIGTVKEGTCVKMTQQYVVSLTINLPQGVMINGYGATLKAANTSLNPVLRIYNKNSPSIPYSYTLNVLGLTIEGDSYANRGVLKGIDIDANFVAGYLCTLRDCNIQWFQTGVQLNSGNRMIVLDNCRITTKTVGLKIIANTGVFVGDSWIKGCQIECEAGTCITMPCTGTGSKISGIHINDCVLYGVGITATCDNTTAQIQDVFIDNVAVDGWIAYVPLIQFTGSTLQLNSSIIQISNIWLNTGTAGIQFDNITAAYINGGKISSIDTMAVVFNNCQSCIINSVNMFDCNKNQTGGGVIKLTGTSTKCKVLGNSIFNSKALANIPIVSESATVKCIIKNNTSDTTAVTLNQGTGNVISDNIGA